MPLPRTALAADGGLPNGNTAEGDFSLDSLTSGSFNSALGYAALFSNTSGDNNTATGSFALYNNTNGPSPLKGDLNTATGSNALYSNTIGNGNTATGVNALLSNTNAYYNTATGFQALYSNNGFFNTATGANALYSNQAAGYNTANGFAALHDNINGSHNTAIGYEALNNSTANDNTATGYLALSNATGSNNIALGSNAGLKLTAGSNNIDIGNQGVAGESGKIRIGTKPTHNGTFIAGISGVAVTGAQVVVNTMGKLGVATSSARFKQAIKPMDKASEAILQLEPVTFRYKEEIDPDGIPQYGLIAEQVEKVDPKLVGRDENGKVNTVRYEAVNAMLLNEFLKEHRQVEELNAMVMKQEATNAQQQKEIKALTTSLKEQASAIQKVSDKVKLSKPSPRVVTNDQ